MSKSVLRLESGWLGRAGFGVVVLSGMLSVLLMGVELAPVVSGPVLSVLLATAGGSFGLLLRRKRGLRRLSQETVEWNKALISSVQESEGRYLQMFENSADNLYLIEVTEDQRFMHLDVNLTYLQQSGLGRDDIVGRYADEIEDESTRRTLLAKYRACLDAGERIEYVSEFDLPVGHRVFHSHLTPIKNEAGRICRIVGAGRDITEQHRAEMLLKKREAEFRTLAENSPDPIFRYDRDCRRIYINPAVTRIGGRALADLLGRTPAEAALVPSVDAVKLMDSLRRVIATGKAEEVETTFYEPDGREFVFHNLHVPEFDAQGSVESVLSIGRDITARKRMEDVLLRSEQEYRALAENSPDSIIRYDRERRIRYLNQNMVSVLGMPAAFLLGKNFTEVFTDGIFDDLESVLELVITTGQPAEHYLTLPDVGEGEHSYHLRIVPERTHDGEVDGLLSIGRDVTERRQFEQALLARAEQEQRLSSYVSSAPGFFFTLILSTDGQMSMPFASNGITSIFGLHPNQVSGGVEPLASRYHPDDVARVLEKVRHSGEHLSDCHVEFRARHPEKGERWVEARSKPGRDAAGNICWHGFMQDITERKQMEEALQRREGMLQAAQRIAHIGSWDVDMVHDKLVWSDETFAIWEIDKTQFKADFSAFLETVHPDDRTSVVDAYNSAVVNHTLYEIEHRLLFPDGRVKHILERGEPQYDAEGRPVRFIGTSLDITERKQMEEQLRLKEYALDHSGDAVFLIDEEARFIYINEQVCHSLGYSREQLLTMSTPDIDPDYSLEKAQAANAQAIAEGFITFETRHQRRDGSIFPVEIQLSALEYGGRMLTLAMVRNITERRRMAASLMVSEREFRSLAESSPDLIARFDRDCRRLYANRAMASLAGKPTDALVGVPPTDGVILSPVDADKLMTGIRSVFANAESVRVELSAVYDDCTHEFDALLVPEFGAEGAVDTVLLLSRDITERKQMEALLIASEREFRSLAENLPDNIARWDVEGRYLYINPTHERLLGVEASEVIGKLLPDAHEHVKAAISQVVATGLAVELVRQTVLIDGELQTHEVSIAPEFDAEGRVVSVLGVGRDMTNIYRMQEAIVAREAEFRVLVEQAPEPIFRYAPDGRRLYVNAAVERISGVSAEVLLGSSPADGKIVGTQQNIVLTTLIKNICETGEAAELEMEQVGADGIRRYFHNRYAPEFDTDGKVKSVLNICHDITARKLAEQTSQRSEQLMRTVVDATPDWIFIKDQEHRYQLVNKGYADDLHISPEDFIGKNDLELGFPEELVKGNPEKGIRGFWADDRLVMDSNKMHVYEDDPATIDGVVHTFHTIKVPLCDGDEKPWGVLAFARDISERKFAEQFEQFRSHLLEFITSDHALPAILEQIVLGVEQLMPDMKCSILSLDTQGKHLINGVAPSLPEFYNEAIDGLEIGLGVGSCGTAAVTGARVVVDDIQTHPYWAPFKALASKAGLGACWSQPIMASSGQVLGTFAIYHREPHTPSAFDIELIEKSARLASIAIERKLGEQHIKAALDFSEGVINAIPDLLFEVDLDGRYLNVWAQNPELLATQKELLLGRTISEVLPSEAAAISMSAIFEADKEGISLGKTLSLDLPQGLSWFELSVSKKQGRDSSDTHYLVLSRDITERKQSESRLKEKLTQIIELNDQLEVNARDLEDQAVELEAQTVELEASQEQIKLTEAWYRGIIHSAPDGMLVVDDRGCIRLVNLQISQMFGYAEGELSGCSIELLLPPDVRESHVARRTGFFASMTQERPMSSVNYALRGCRRDGSEFPVDVSLSRLPDLEGQRGVICATIRDVTERKYMEDALALREREFRTLSENSPDAIMRYDRECRRTYVNPACIKLIGKPFDELLGKTPAQYPQSPYAPAYENALRQVLETGVPCEHEYIWPSQGDVENISLFSMVPEFDTEGRVVGALAMGRDITERKQMEETLAAREQESRTLLENSPDNISRYDRHCRRLYVNRAFGNRVEGGVSMLLNKTPSECPGGPDSDIYEAKIAEVFESGLDAEFELKWPDKDGREICSHVRLTPELDKVGEVASVLSVGRDITELNEHRKRVYQMAFYDALTELPNRALFNDRLRQMLNDAAWHGQLAGVMLLDLDRFKVVNDTLGHPAGDELLRDVATRLSYCVRGYDTVARLGGDEFAILLPEVRSGDDLGRVASNILESFKEPFMLEGKEVFVSSSIGIAVYPADSPDGDDLLKQADSAMYFAKRSGRNNFRFYSKDLTVSANERLTLEGDLRRGFGRGELELYYQPKINLSDSALIGSEALLRWHHPERGMVPPDKFISIAEDCGLIVEIGAWVLESGCKTAALWNGEEKPLHKVAINLSARQFQSNDLIRTVRTVLEKTGCRPEWIELEITESLLMDEGGEVLSTLALFRDMGITIAIDDFGTGYSSLSYLARFPINTLKIDRSFTSRITQQSHHAELVKAILSIARSLNQKVVAEGVETEEQAAFLRRHGCDIAQGYLYSKPVPKVQFEALPRMFL